jgi:hypothetical protein
MTDTIEPTEEQCEAVKAWCTTELGVRYGWRHIARFLAEREHRATTLWRANEAAARADARVVMEHWRADAATHRASFMVDIEGAEKLNTELRAGLDAARARIAELESENTFLVVQLDLYKKVEAHNEGLREERAAHLAHIKALHQFLGDREEQEGIWIPRAEFKDIPKHVTAHYDVEGEETK